MADPISLSAMSMGASAGGGILSAFGAIAGGKSQRAMYDYQASVAKINADIDRQNSEWELTKGGIEQTQYGLKAGQQFAQIRASQGASGVDVNSGSARDVQTSQQKITSMDLQQIGANAAKTAYDYTVRETADLNQAKIDQIAGKNAETAGYINAASSIIGSAGSVSSKWLQAKQAGVFGGGDTSGPIHLFGPDQTVTGYA